MPSLRSLVCAIFAFSPVCFATRYTSITSTAELVQRLGLDGSTAAQVNSALNGYNESSSNIAALEAPGRAALACKVSKLILAQDEVTEKSSSSYQSLVQVNWCDSCWLEPRCIVQPKSAAEVSRVLAIVSFLATKFAIRSGGHNPNPKFAAVDDYGVLIDTVRLNEVTIHDTAGVVSVGPGIRAGALYKALDKANRTIIGPRLADVGIGGYFLGGGLTFFSSRYGMAADSVVNFEVVLANSSIVNANATSNPDLWWALKGGGANFGVVTRFDIRTLKGLSIWTEGLVYDASQSDKLLDAVADFAVAAEKDLDATLTFFLTTDAGYVQFIYAKPTVRPPIYDQFYAIKSANTSAKSTITSMSGLVDSISDITSLDKARRMVGSIVFQFNKDVMRKSFDLYKTMAHEVAGFTKVTGYAVQPYTSAAFKHQLTTGGNPTGFREVTSNLLTYSIEWHDSANDAVALAALDKFTRGVEKLAQDYGVYLESKAMNDAGFAQKVIQSFGPQNVARLKSVSKAYDGFGVFQDLQNGGFLLKDV